MSYLSSNMTFLQNFVVKGHPSTPSKITQVNQFLPLYNINKCNMDNAIKGVQIYGA